MSRAEIPVGLDPEGQVYVEEIRVEYCRIGWPGTGGYRQYRARFMDHRASSLAEGWGTSVLDAITDLHRNLRDRKERDDADGNTAR